MNLVHESFLRWLHDQRNHERLLNYTVYDGYYNGDHEIKIPPKVKAALQSELGTVLNYCRLVVDSSVDYIAGGEIGIEVKESPEAEALLYDVYDENGLLGSEMFKTLTVMGKKGDVFLKLYVEDNEIKVSVLRPDICFPRYKADDYRELMYCSIQWFQEEDEFGQEEDEGGKLKAQVFRPDSVDYYELVGDRDDEKTSWEFVRTEKNLLGFIPIIHVKNTIDDLEFGVSDIQIMSDLQDGLNKTITDMLLSMDNTAFQRLAIFGGQSPKGHELQMEPGAITEFPDADAHLDVIPPGELAPFVMAMKEIVDQIMTVTQLSKITIMKPDAPLPPSGLALRIHYIPQERKADKKVAVLEAQFKELNQMIFKAAEILGKGSFVGLKTTLHFEGGLPVDEQMQMAVDEMELRARIRSRRTIMQQRGVEDIDAEMALIREEEDEARQKELEFEIELAKAVAAADRRATV